VLALLSVCLIYASYSIGRNWFSERSGRLAAVLAAIWYELLYVSTVATPEVLSTYAIVGALALVTGPATARRAILVGLLLGASIALRLQYAVPAVALWLLAVIKWQRRSALTAALAGAIVIGFAGLLDAWTWGTPFISYYNNLDFNLLLEKQDVFGRSPPFAYLSWLTISSVGLYLLAAGYGVLQWKRCWPIFVAARLRTSAALSDTAQEYRFVILVVPLLLVLLADATINGSQQLRRTFGDRAVIGVAITAVATVSVVECVMHGVFARDDRLLATLDLSRRRDVTAVLDLPASGRVPAATTTFTRTCALFSAADRSGANECGALACKPRDSSRGPGGDTGFRLSTRYRSVAVLDRCRRHPPTGVWKKTAASRGRRAWTTGLTRGRAK